MKGKIMTTGNLEDITNRLAGCQALLYVLCESASASSISENAVRGVSDLLDSICRDRQADIDAAEDYVENES